MTIECSQSVHSIVADPSIIVADPSIIVQTFDSGKYAVYHLYWEGMIQ